MCAGLVFEALLVLPEVLVFPVVLVVVVLVVIAGVVTGLAVTRFAFAFALFAGRFALLAASPQAIPMAVKPRTVESTITFFIFIRLLIFLKDFLLILIKKSADQTQPDFASNSFYSKQTSI